MKPLFRNILFLIMLEILVLFTGFLLVSNFSIGIDFIEIALLSLAFSLLALLTLVIFFRGQTKEPESQTMHSLVSVSLKFFIELVFVFIWFFIANKTGISSVLLFFVLYLTFTLFSVFIILKTLKHKSL